jgi:hypothetical protein
MVTCVHPLRRPVDPLSFVNQSKSQPRFTVYDFWSLGLLSIELLHAEAIVRNVLKNLQQSFKDSNQVRNNRCVHI